MPISNLDFILKGNGVYIPVKPKKKIIAEVRPDKKKPQQIIHQPNALASDTKKPKKKTGKWYNAVDKKSKSKKDGTNYGKRKNKTTKK